MIQYSHYWVFTQKEDVNLKRYVHPCVYSSIIYKRRGTEEATCPSRDEWVKIQQNITKA